ncbi:pitrilysin family protein [Sphingomonas sp. BK235]|uniref:M16 family metallopeptidase n=1 Tax=Sphingomonas sp. BK235 TaxID=2512131 RepID=UPI0014048099|nr:pitrilysin family protein [Sphingomonas sp. BK235]
MAAAMGCMVSTHALAAATAAPHRPPAVAPDEVERTRLVYDRFTLPNGLTVLVYTDHTAPKVLVSLTYRVGSKDEPAGKTGFAHLFEHMMFQETEHRKGEYFTPFLQSGVSNINGNTTTDRTRYFELVPKRALDLALWMESDRMQYLPGAIDTAALDGQRAVVKNEKRQTGTPDSNARADALRAALYPSTHPYAHTVIGSMQDLDAASVDDVRTWFDTYYGASNAILLLAGDIDPAEAREKVTKYFKDVRPGHLVQQISRWVPVLDERKDLHFFSKGGGSSFARTWPVPSADEQDGVLLQVLQETITGTPQSALNRALVENDGPARGVYASYNDAALNGTFSIAVDLKPGADAADAERRLDAALAQLKQTGPDATTLRENLHIKDKSFLAALEDPESVGSILEAGELSRGDPLRFLQTRRWEKEATPQTIAAAARRWLDRPYINERDDPEPTTSPAVAGSVDRSGLPKVPPAVEVQEPFAPIERATLSNGAQLVVVRRPRVPMVSVSLVFATGSAIDHPYPRGLAAHTFGSLFEGSRRYGESAIGGRMRALAIAPSSSSDERQSKISFSTDHAGLSEAVDFVTEVLREPIFPQRKIDEFLVGVDRSYDGFERDSRSWQSGLFSRALWGPDHWYGHIRTRAEAKQVTRDALLDFYAHEVAPANLTAYFIGDVTLDEARALLERGLGDWHKGVKPAPTIDAPPARPTGVRVVLIDVPGAEQSQITAGRLIGRWEPRHALIEQLANGALGGSFSSRLNMNLREDKGWSYGFHSGLGASLRSQRTFTLGGAVQTDKTVESIREILRELHDYTDARPITAKEFEEQRTVYLDSISWQLVSNLAYQIIMVDAQDRGLPLDYSVHLAPIVHSITLPEAQAVARESFRADDLVWSIAGDLRKIEAGIRALNLGPVEVQDGYGHRLR